VCNPKKAAKGDHIVYTVYGEDAQGKFEIHRRFKEFHLLRQTLYQRYPGLYVPPCPPKRKMGNSNSDFIEERCFYLNMFFKQLVRCPYLFESEEFKLFVRPPYDVEKGLTYLPKLSNQRFLEKISRFYSILGDIDQFHLQSMNLEINNFCLQCRQNLQFMNNFKQMVTQMESSFDSGWGCNNKLNSFFFDYEKNVLTGHLQSLNHRHKGVFTGQPDMISRGTMPSRKEEEQILVSGVEASHYDISQFILFENPQKRELKE